MTKVIGVRFRTAGKVYYFDPLEFDIKKGDHVIVETARGIEYGTVVGDPREVEDEQIVSTLKPVLRVAAKRDTEQEEENKRKEKEAFKICNEKIKEHGLDMKLIDAEYTFDNNKVLFYFTADGRIDFRDLVKDLASVFRTRIELRQIGVRDETKIRGGIGICGRPLCCHSYLSDFVPVSIKMAKEQNLSLNPTKISGMCGRLMCCLKNEQDTYEELNRKLPVVGDAVICPGGLKGEVSSVNVLRQTVKVIVEQGEDREVREFPAEEIHFHHHKNSKIEITEEELQAVRDLEEKNDLEGLEPEEHSLKVERKERPYRERSRETRTRETAERKPRKNRGENAENGRDVKPERQTRATRTTTKERDGEGTKAQPERSRNADRPKRSARANQGAEERPNAQKPSEEKPNARKTAEERPNTQKSSEEKSNIQKAAPEGAAENESKNQGGKTGSRRRNNYRYRKPRRTEGNGQGDES